MARARFFSSLAVPQRIPVISALAILLFGPFFVPYTADYKTGKKQSVKKVRLWILIFLLFYGFCSRFQHAIANSSPEETGS